MSQQIFHHTQPEKRYDHFAEKVEGKCRKGRIFSVKRFYPVGNTQDIRGRYVPFGRFRSPAIAWLQRTGDGQMSGNIHQGQYTTDTLFRTFATGCPQVTVSRQIYLLKNKHFEIKRLQSWKRHSGKSLRRTKGKHGK